jgi:hypothetical protein
MHILQQRNAQHAVKRGFRFLAEINLVELRAFFRFAQDSKCVEDNPASKLKTDSLILEARVGFEPTDGGFADLSLRPLGYRAFVDSTAFTALSNEPLFIWCHRGAVARRGYGDISRPRFCRPLP